MTNILVTGCAGFIGFHLASKLTKKKNFVVHGIDSMNNYYNQKLKRDRLFLIKKNTKKNFKFHKIDLKKINPLNKIFKKNKIDYVIHLAAQPGVRYSITNPNSYIENNLIGFYNLIKLSVKYKIKHFIFASSSSVYGYAKKFPITETGNTDQPLSLYAATKKSNELIAHSFANIYKLPCTALRFFTVYGPFGRPDMALFKFSEKIIKNQKIDLYNNGRHMRDFTFIDDAINMVLKLIHKIPKNKIPIQTFNIASGKPIKLFKYLNLIEKNLNKKAKINYLPIQKGDMIKTHSKVKKLIKLRKYTPIEKGIKAFVVWYLSYLKK